MLKKVVFFVLAVMLLQGVCSASNFSENWRRYQNDPNYIHCSAKIGSEYYIDRSSVEVELDDDPEYIVSVEVVEVRGSEVIVGKKKFYYDEDAGEMYIHTARDTWIYCADAPQWEPNARFSRAGDIAFYLAFGRSFYIETETIASHVNS